MRIALSGCANSGKTTLLSHFLQKWPMYTTPVKTYRDIITEKKLDHSSKTSDVTQLMILDWMLQEMKKHPQGSHIIYDRCPLDNLVYTLQGNVRGLISDATTAATISFVRESMKDLDIIFWLKYNPKIKIMNDGFRDFDEEYIKETDAFFATLFDQYMENLESDVFLPKDDCPLIFCIDETFSTIDDRLMLIGEFLDKDGNLIETENSVLSMENLETFEQLMGDQKKQQEADENIKNILKNLK